MTHLLIDQYSFYLSMQLIVKLSETSSEWGLVELQGVLETHGDQSMDGQYIGDLHFTGTTPNLIVGHHLLTGKVVNLDKPLAVMKNTKGEGKERQFEIVATIKKKIIFRNRPKPLVGLKK